MVGKWLTWNPAASALVVLDQRYQFALDEPVNEFERGRWWRELVPLYDGRPYLTSCVHRIYIGRLPEFDLGDWCSITPAPLTVEADGEGPFRTDVEALLWINRWEMDRFEFEGSDGLDLADGLIADFVLFRLPLGEAHVSPCEVTL